MSDLPLPIEQLILLLAPILLLQFGLIVAALLDLRKRQQTRGPKWLWVIIIIFLNLLGPIAYFVYGRQET